MGSVDHDHDQKDIPSLKYLSEGFLQLRNKCPNIRLVVEYSFSPSPHLPSAEHPSEIGIFLGSAKKIALFYKFAQGMLFWSYSLACLIILQRLYFSDFSMCVDVNIRFLVKFSM